MTFRPSLPRSNDKVYYRHNKLRFLFKLNEANRIVEQSISAWLYRIHIGRRVLAFVCRQRGAREPQHRHLNRIRAESLRRKHRVLRNHKTLRASSQSRACHTEATEDCPGHWARKLEDAVETTSSLQTQTVKSPKAQSSRTPLTIASWRFLALQQSRAAEFHKLYSSIRSFLP